MKAISLFALFLLFSFKSAVAQNSTAAKRPAASATNQPASTTSGSTTNKPDIKDLIKAPGFTNDTGVSMVKISPTLWAGMFEVTQKEYQKVTGSNPSEFSGDNNPVDSVSWNDARGFCSKLTEAEKKAEMLPEGFEYTLPTQAQWESLMDAADLKDAITSEKTSRTGTAPVGTLKPNSLNLYDTRGNVWELCLDPDDKPYRVLRGAAWDSWIDVNLRPEFRWYSNGPDDKKNTFGFRCVLVPVAGK
jgi:formylglycine-generating enzyme required for sulfatase activity